VKSSAVGTAVSSEFPSLARSRDASKLPTAFAKNLVQPVGTFFLLVLRNKCSLTCGSQSRCYPMLAKGEVGNVIVIIIADKATRERQSQGMENNGT
jgi:hypothetical protein